MKGSEKKFGKYTKIVERIEFLTEAVVKNPNNNHLKKELKKAEDGLCNMIQREQKEIDKLVESLTEDHEEEWDE